MALMADPQFLSMPSMNLKIVINSLLNQEAVDRSIHENSSIICLTSYFDICTKHTTIFQDILKMQNKPQAH